MRQRPILWVFAACAALLSCSDSGAGSPESLVASQSGSPKVVVTPGETTLHAGETQQFHAALVTPSGHEIRNRGFTWMSSNPDVVSVSPMGLATAVAPGCGTITATTNPFSGTAQVTVVGEATHPDGVIVATVPLGDRPFGAAVSSCGTYHITRLDAARVERGDLPAFSFTASVPAGTVPTNVAFNPAGTRSYVTNQFSGSIGEIDVAANSQVRQFAVSGDPFVVIVSRDGRTVYASNNANNLFVIDVATGAIVKTLTFSSIINGLALNAAGTRLYASTLFAGTLEEIDTETNTVLRSMSIGGNVLQDVAVSLDGTEAYVADEGGVVHFVDLTLGAQSGTVSLAGAGFGLALSPDNAQLYVSIMFNGVVQVIDRASRAIIKTISTGGTPRRLAFSRGGETAVVANEGGWVDFIR